MKLTLKLLVVALIISFSSCKKEDNLRREKMTLLTTGAWRIALIEQKASDGKWVDVTGTRATTVADNLSIFYSNGEYIVDEGPTKESGNAQIIDYGNWKFADKGKKIEIIGKDLREILELNDNKLVVLIEGTSQRYTYERP